MPIAGPAIAMPTRPPAPHGMDPNVHNPRFGQTAWRSWRATVPPNLTIASCPCRDALLVKQVQRPTPRCLARGRTWPHTHSARASQMAYPFWARGAYRDLHSLVARS